jgi:hypothetical protein
MITDEQFNDAFTAAGGWFFLTQYELIKSWYGKREDLVDLIYNKGFDAKRSGSNTRVSSALRIIEEGREKDALIKIRDSKRINHDHPEAAYLASELLKKHCD